VYIPLDYYRILGLPIQATAEQLRQAHRDRTLQLPRREYSDAAIAARKQLLDEAYAVLSAPDRRQAYDASFLAKTYELAPDAERSTTDSSTTYTVGPVDSLGADPHTPSIEIQEGQLVGALLLLQELGEYELVLKLGRPFLTGGKVHLKSNLFREPDIAYADIVLTVALACLELGREQWQQGQYENAAEALDTGQQLLLREGLFAGVRGEIQADLYKLRPYRVLELLALPEHQTVDRHRGLQLLQEMLAERGGIDGPNHDHSGLNIDDFLRFIQQLRSYLTAGEQQVLFEQEAQRPSAVATYLAVYALMAKGFADREPALVQRAKQMLQRLSVRQDVALEQAVCALLLGQTEEASQSLEHSQEYAPIAFIRDHSQGSPDLLPGLCLYTERWLQDEVFPHFRDLVQQRVTLKDYFADAQVQGYLEALPSEPEVADDWSIAQPAPTVSRSATVADRVTTRQQSTLTNRPSRNVANRTTSLSEGQSAETLIEVARARIAARTASNVASTNGGIGGVATMPAAERVNPQGNGGLRPELTTATLPPRRRRSDRGRRGSSDELAGTVVNSRDRTPPQPPGVGNLRRWMPIALVAGVAVLGFIGGPWLLKALQASSKQDSQMEQPLVQLDRPVISIPQPTAMIDPNAPTLTNQSAQMIVESWLAAKAAALGPEHNIAKLDQILVDPKLTEWRAAAEDDKAANTHRKFKHVFKVTAVEQPKETPDRAKVTADVIEATEFFKAGTAENSTSEQLRVTYSLVRKDTQWKIENWSWE
jgi:hypothetical protein